MPDSIRPLGLGEILNQGISLFRRNFVPLAGSFAAVYLPVQLILRLGVGTFPDLPGGMQDMTQEQYAAAMSSIAATRIVFALIGGTALFIAYMVAEGVLIHRAARAYLGESESIGGSPSFGFSRLVPLLLTCLLKGILIGIGLILLVAPGIYLLFRYALSTSVVVIEGLTGVKALERSRKLMAPGIHILQLLMLGAIGALISFAVAVPVGMLGENILTYVVAAVVQTLVSAFTATLFVVFYFSARCRIDGFDLDRLAESLAARNVPS